MPITYDLSNIPQNKFRPEAAGANGSPYFTAYLTAAIRIHQGRVRFSIMLEDEELAVKEMNE